MKPVFNPFTGKLDYINDGNVVGPASSANGDVAAFDGTTGKLLKAGDINVAKFNTSPTPGTHAAGKMYWDATWKTGALMLDDDSILQMGQETMAYVKNANVVAGLTEGQVVYINGAASGIPTVSLADATDDAKSYVLGVVTSHTIAQNGFGYVTIRGHVNDLNTNAWNVDDVLYLDDTTPGGLTTTPPSAGNNDIRIGRVMIKDATGGRVYVNVRPLASLDTLSDVTIATPALDEVLRYNGVEWVNGASATSSASAGIDFFNSTPVITSRTAPAGISQAGTAGNGIQINSLSKTPVTTAEQTQTMLANADTRAGSAWLYDTALGRTSIDAGLWEFTTYASVSSLTGTNTVTRQIYQVVPGTGTLDITGIATNTRLAKITASQMTGTYYVPSATNTTASYLQATSGTNKGQYQITSKVYKFTVTSASAAVGDTYTNNGATFTVVETLAAGTTLYATGTGDPAASGNLVRTAGAGTDPIVFSAWNVTDAAMITVRTGYANETGVTYNIWNKLFGVTTPDLTSTTLSEYNTTISQPAFTIAATDKIGGMMFVTASSAADRTFTVAYDGTLRNSHVSTPLITLHNNLAGLQGGAANSYYHLTSAQATVATQAATAAQNGYATSTQITKLDGIEAGATANAKATGAELDTGTDDAKFATAKAIKDAHNVPSVAPGTSGNVLTSDGTDWTSAAPAVSASSTTTFTNKRITPRITTIVSDATPTVNTDNCDCVTITALAAAITSMTTNLSGTPTNFQRLTYRILDNGTARAITWGASFVARGVALPTTTVLSKVLNVGFLWNAVTNTWDCVAATLEA